MLNKNIRLVIKGLIFIALTMWIITEINNITKQKSYYNNRIDEISASNTFENFYELERDTVDVLFFGSSHAAYSFNPQVIYDKYGITSYNLGSPEQSVLISYYWLKEALKYQSPKVVVLDTYTFHQYLGNFENNKLNCTEASVRKAMDCMRPSPLKIEAARAIEQNDPTQSWESFFLLNLRYHSRWKNLNEDDFSENEMVNHGDMKGYAISGYAPEGAHDIAFDKDDIAEVEAEPMVETATEYLDKIVNLCNQNGIKLVLVSIPTEEPITRYKSTKQYADEHNILFYDFNEIDLYHEVDYSCARDNYSHPNYVGAEKISTYLGNVFKEKYHIEAREDKSFDKSKLVYEHKLNNIMLTKEDDIYSYLDLLNDDYDVFLFVPVENGDYIDGELLAEIQAQGFSDDIRNSKDGKHYCALKSDDSIYEELTAGNVSHTGSLRDVDQYSFCIDKTAVDPGWHKYSLIIEGEECCEKIPGIDVIIYDEDMHKVIDRVNIDTTVPELTMSHY